MPIIVFVSRYYQIASMFVQFTSIAYPQLNIETVADFESIKHKNAYMVVGIAEESQCELLLARFPKNLRIVSRNSIITDFSSIMDHEGIEPRSKGL